ncbi:MAG: apolipoprotein N-acyltransferase [Propionibacteriaceae bacterium]
MREFLVTARWLQALVAGVALGLSWQPFNLWPLAPFAIAALTLIVRTARPRRAFGLGYLFALAMLVPAIGWIHVLGVPIAAALIAFESLFFGALAVALRLVSRLPAWPLWAACCWVLCEFGYSRIPFGGFGWTRIAYTTLDSPLAGWFSLIGVAGVSFLLALAGQGLAWFALRLRTHRRSGFEVAMRRATAVLAAGAVLLVGGGLVAGAATGAAVASAPTEGEVAIGIVQGNVPGRGVEAMGRARTVTNNHLAETKRLMEKAAAGEETEPDLILWPENSTDIDPLRDSVTRRTVQEAAVAAGVPVLVGAVMAGPGEDERQTSALWWDADQGVVDRYDKRNLVPFGEWIPFRDQLLPVIPMLEQVGAQSVPGTTPGVLTGPLADGRTLRVGDIICFELAYDDTVRDTVTHGGQVLVVQSNNATYGGTGQIEQQFAITRARALELQREIAVATTNSVSGLIDARGRVVQRTDEFTAASMSVTMPVRDNVSIAVRIGPWLNRGLALAGVLALLAALVTRRGDRFAPVRENGRNEERSDRGEART